MINDRPYSHTLHSQDALSEFDPCCIAVEPLCAAQRCGEASSKLGGPSPSSTHRPSPWAPGARAARPQSSPSTRLKGVKSAWLIITIICKCASCSRAEDTFDLWCCKRLQLLCCPLVGDIWGEPTLTKYDFIFFNSLLCIQIAGLQPVHLLTHTHFLPIAESLSFQTKALPHCGWEQRCYCAWRCSEENLMPFHTAVSCGFKWICISSYWQCFELYCIIMFNMLRYVLHGFWFYRCKTSKVDKYWSSTEYYC